MKDRLVNQDLYKLTDLASQQLRSLPVKQPSYTRRVFGLGNQTPLESPRIDTSIERLPLRLTSQDFSAAMPLPKDLGYSLSKESSPDIIKRIDVERKPKISFFQPIIGDYKKANFFTNHQTVRHSVRLPDGQMYEHRPTIRLEDRLPLRHSVTAQSHGHLPESPFHFTSAQSNISPETFLKHEPLQQDSPVRGQYFLRTQESLEGFEKRTIKIEEGMLTEMRQSSSRKIELIEVPDLTSQLAGVNQPSKTISFDHDYPSMPVSPYQQSIPTEIITTPQNLYIGSFKQFVENKSDKVDIKKALSRNTYMPLLGHLKPMSKADKFKDGEHKAAINDPIAPVHESPVLYKNFSVMQASQPLVSTSNYNSVPSDVHRTRPSHGGSHNAPRIELTKSNFLTRINPANLLFHPPQQPESDMTLQPNDAMVDNVKLKHPLRSSVHQSLTQNTNPWNQTEGNPVLHRNSSVSHQPAHRLIRPPISGGGARLEHQAGMGILPMPGFDLKSRVFEERPRSPIFSSQDHRSSGFLRSHTYHPAGSD